MKQEDFKKQYPNLWKLLNIISYANDMAMRDTFGQVDGFLIEELEVQASKLAEDEFEVMADGEHLAMRTLVNKKQLWTLDEFLTSAFDGDLSHEIYQL